MTIDFTKKRPFAILIIVVEAIVFTAFSLLLFHTHLDKGMPASVKLWGPVFLFVVSCWFFIAKGPGYGSRNR